MLEVYFVGLLGKYHKNGIYSVSGVMTYSFNENILIPVMDSNVNEYTIKGIECDTLGRIVAKVYSYNIMRCRLINSFQGLVDYYTYNLPAWDADSLELITIDLVDKPLYMESFYNKNINTHTLKMATSGSPISLFLNLDSVKFRICYNNTDINTLETLDVGLFCMYDEDSTYMQALQQINIQDFNGFTMLNNFCYTDTLRLSGNNIILPSECETFLVDDSNISYKKASLVFPPKIKSIQLINDCYKSMVVNTYYFSKHTKIKVIVDFGLKICHILGNRVDGSLFYWYLVRNKIKDGTNIQELEQYMKALVKIKESNYNSTVNEVVSILNQLKLKVEIY